MRHKKMSENVDTLFTRLCVQEGTLFIWRQLKFYDIEFKVTVSYKGMNKKMF